MASILRTTFSGGTREACLEVAAIRDSNSRLDVCLEDGAGIDAAASARGSVVGSPSKKRDIAI